MLKNTINVTSWLLLNALVPSALPEHIINEYKNHFVKWSKLTSFAQMNFLFASLKSLRFIFLKSIKNNFCVF